MTINGTAYHALEAKKLTKRFGDYTALANVDLNVDEGEVVALLGQNGSGKSTLVKILSGYHSPEPGGELSVGGVRVPLPVPSGAYRDLGLSFVFQDLGLASGLRVVENLFAGRRRESVPHKARPISWAAEYSLARKICANYELNVDPRALVSDLRPTEQALLAIVRAAEEVRIFRERSDATGSGVLVLDEPTVFLPEHEKIFLFELVKRITGDGTGVLFVSHDMTAIRQIANRALILQDGKCVGDVVIKDVTDDELIERISGYDTRRSEPLIMTSDQGEPGRTSSLSGDTAGTRVGIPIALEIENLTSNHLKGVDLTIHQGEIVGVAGLLGSGSDDIPYAVFGALQGVQGRVRVGGWSSDAGRLTPRRAREVGMALVPADRKQQGVAASLSVQKNMMALVTGKYFQYGLLSHGRMRTTARERIHSFAIKPSEPDIDMAALSGGNQQKVLLAKWIEQRPTVLLLHEPTQGVDVATRAEIYALMRSLKSVGVGILWVSTDFDELATICDSILVCADGRIIGTVDERPYSRDQITSSVYAAEAQQALGV